MGAGHRSLGRSERQGHQDHLREVHPTQSGFCSQHNPAGNQWGHKAAESFVQMGHELRNTSAAQDAHFQRGNEAWGNVPAEGQCARGAQYRWNAFDLLVHNQ